ncbi:MAG: PIG-L family deacetylase [bacterium]
MSAAEKVLYVFAHQDDEVMVFVKMALDIRRGREVHALWLTDSAFYEPAEVREQESRNAMKLLGLTHENLHFLGYPDAQAYKHLENIFRDASAVAEKLQPVEITSNAFEGGHIDHDAASLIASLIAGRLPCCKVHYEFPSYNMYGNRYRVNEFLPGDDCETLRTPVDDELIGLKLKSLEMYPTQAHVIETLKSIANVEEMMKSGEPYRVSPAHDYTKRPVEPLVAYEVTFPVPLKFEYFRDAAVELLRKIEDF